MVNRSLQEINFLMCSETVNHFDKVLVIDDDEVDLYITGRIIDSSGFPKEVIKKTSVDSAIEYLNSLQISHVNSIQASFFSICECLEKMGIFF